MDECWHTIRDGTKGSNEEGVNDERVRFDRSEQTGPRTPMRGPVAENGLLPVEAMFRAPWKEVKSPALFIQGGAYMNAPVPLRETGRESSMCIEFHPRHRPGCMGTPAHMQKNWVARGNHAWYLRLPREKGADEGGATCASY